MVFHSGSVLFSKLPLMLTHLEDGNNDDDDDDDFAKLRLSVY